MRQPNEIEINGKKLDAILEEHRAWANDEESGIRANLSIANLRGADLSGADLSGAHLGGADLRGAIYKDVEIQKTRIFSGLYKYQIIAIIADDGTQHIAMGSKFQTREDWVTNFWNNTAEFPDNDSEKTALRKFALRVACEWLDMQEK